jgi:hypothetical protein
MAGIVGLSALACSIWPAVDAVGFQNAEHADDQR